ncbi:helix-turn-helix transcriptional regulator [Pseudooceanicola marinus]|uniref:helix-turn-helix transcriptional regulator n=1 Tax=Pseudooceanicola marinus TaxID=396013 RepID=UPI001CD1C385|nr:AraC family transcriptional regulator [Pseudooceanicola marinus]MCA1334260.1 AraC family transcriptional regulator [Pseudooceanicola marinus]
MADYTPPTVRSQTLSQLSGHEDWRLTLPHARSTHLFLFLSKGQGRTIVLGRRRGLTMNTVLFVPAGTLMMLDIGKQSYGQVVQIPADAGLVLPGDPVQLRVRESMAQAELIAIIDAMQREQATHRPYGAEALQAHAGLLSVWLRRLLASEPAPVGAGKAADRLAAAFCALVERDFRSSQSMADFAATLGVTPTHLTRTLRQTAGITAAEILTGRTLHEARGLLQDGSLPIGLISEMLGFSSAAYFTRFIQKHTGKTPTALRRRR